METISLIVIGTIGAVFYEINTRYNGRARAVKMMKEAVKDLEARTEEYQQVGQPKQHLTSA